ncbi:hypothetical protein D3C72_2092250 [compost metagenome]
MTRWRSEHNRNVALAAIQVLELGLQTNNWDVVEQFYVMQAWAGVRSNRDITRQGGIPFTLV